jgi:hypothetical protein
VEFKTDPERDPHARFQPGKSVKNLRACVFSISKKVEQNICIGNEIAICPQLTELVIGQPVMSGKARLHFDSAFYGLIDAPALRLCLIASGECL